MWIRVCIKHIGSLICPEDCSYFDTILKSFNSQNVLCETNVLFHKLLLLKCYKVFYIIFITMIRSAKSYF